MLWLWREKKYTTTRPSQGWRTGYSIDKTTTMTVMMGIGYVESVESERIWNKGWM